MTRPIDEPWADTSTRSPTTPTDDDLRGDRDRRPTTDDRPDGVTQSTDPPIG